MLNLKAWSLTTLLTLAHLLAAPAFAKGPGGSGGGNVVLCTPSKENNLSGFYFLDYLFVGKPEELETIQYSESVDKSVYLFLKKIEAKLEQTAPAMAVSLKNYIHHINNTDPSKTHVWEFSLFPPDPVPYAGLGFDITQTNCRNLYQTIVRTEDGKVTRYKVYSNMLNKLRTQQDLYQYSFALVHEWLWELLPENEEGIRKVNGYLHSKVFFQHDEERVVASLTNLAAPKGWKMALMTRSAFNQAQINGRNQGPKYNLIMPGELNEVALVNIKRNAKLRVHSDLVFYPGQTEIRLGDLGYADEFDQRADRQCTFMVLTSKEQNQQRRTLEAGQELTITGAADIKPGDPTFVVVTAINEKTGTRFSFTCTSAYRQEHWQRRYPLDPYEPTRKMPTGPDTLTYYVPTIKTFELAIGTHFKVPNLRADIKL